MGALAQDLKYAFRTLAKSPGFTLTAVATLALGIGANTAIFSIVDGVLLRPLPYPSPDRLVTMPKNVSLLELLDLKAATRSFEGMGGVVSQPLALTGGSEPIQLSAGLVAEDYFTVLGARPERGRILTREDDVLDGERVAVLTHGLWIRQWGGDEGIIGRKITLAGNPYTVVGVLRADFAMPEGEADVFVPLRVGYPAGAKYRGVHFLRSVFRMKPDVSLAAARAELDAACTRMAELHPDENAGTSSDLMGLLDVVVGDSRRPLTILSGAVGVVLLIACANLANLLMARGAARRSEMAIRAALGASRSRLTRQLLTESALLALIGGALGALLAAWASSLLLAHLPEGLPRVSGIAIDGRVAAFTLVLSLLTGVAFGLMPAWKASRRGFGDALSGARGTAGAEPHRARQGLVVAEIALAMVLLVGAGLLVNALWRLQSVPPGFDSSNLLTARLDLPEARYPEVGEQTAFRERVLEGLNGVPGVEAALVSEIPLGGSALHHNFLIDGRPPIDVGEEPSLYARSVMGRYFHTMRIPLKAGRDLAASDRAGTPLVGVVNESMVREYFPGQNPLGARVRWAREEKPQWIEIVGVAADVNHFGLADGEAPAIYVPYAQSQQNWKRWQDLVVRGAGGLAGLAELMRVRVWAVDSAIPVGKVQSVNAVVATSLARQRFYAQLLAVFAGVALVLSAVGIYGVMWNSVRQRTTEIGIRVALGAAPNRVVREVLVEGARLTLLGLGIGLALALAASRALASLLFSVRPTDPPTYAAVALTLAAVALLACYVPARRAATIDPMRALRAE